MKIFVSWSGHRSRLVAAALKDWLPDVIHSVEAFMSEHDLDAGARWSAELGARLEGSNFGIICVTPENVSAPWLLFEAGSLGKSVNHSRVVPYRIEIPAPDVPFPLAQFQSVSADRDGTLKLLESIVAVSGSQLGRERLNRVFERSWPDLESRLANAVKLSDQAPRQRPERELLEELVQLVRGFTQRPDGGLETFVSGAIEIDPWPLLGSGSRAFQIRFDPEQRVDNFLDKVWGGLNRTGFVPAFTWGDLWMLFDKTTGKALDTFGIEYSRSRGTESDNRSIASVGLRPGMKLEARPYASINANGKGANSMELPVSAKGRKNRSS